MVDLNTFFRIGFTNNQCKLEEMLSYASTTLTLVANAGAGATSVYVGGGADAVIGDESTWIVIDPYTNQCEVRLVTGITAQPDNTQKLDIRALAYAHSDGDMVFVLREPVIIPQWFGTGSDTNMLRMACAQVYQGEIAHVVIPPGEYNLTSTITLGSGTEMDGYGATLTAAASLAANTPILNANGKTDIAIRGIEIDGDAVVNLTCKGIRFATTAANVTIDDCYIHGPFQNGILFSGNSTDCQVNHCEVEDAYGDGILVSGISTDVTLTDCNVHDCDQHGIFANTTATGGDITRFKAINCKAHDNGYYGILVVADHHDTYDCEIIDCETHDNHASLDLVNGSAGIGMWTDAFVLPALPVGVHYRPVIRNCQADNNHDGISVQNARNGTFTGNCTSGGREALSNGMNLYYSWYCTLSDNHVSEIPARGIELKVSNYNSVLGNTVINADTSNTANMGGIDLIGNATHGCTYNTIIGNTIANVGATGHMDYGVAECIIGLNLSDYNLIADNQIVGMETLGVWWNGKGTKVRDNRGFATEGRGNGSMVGGATSVTIAHHLDHTPNITDIVAYWGGNCLAATALWVDSVDATNIVVKCNPTPDPALAVPVYWHGRINSQS